MLTPAEGHWHSAVLLPMDHIPVFKPLIEPEEMAAAQAALEMGWLGMGEYVGRFEAALGDTLELEGRHVVALSTGHAALHIGLLLAQVGPEQRARYGKTFAVPTRAARRLEFVGSVTAMDAAIGRLLDMLDEYGIADNTIVLFFSDNGGGGSADNAPLRGRKGQMFEGGLRVPCIVRWPGKIPAGTASDEFLTSLEIFPMHCDKCDRRNAVFSSHLLL